LPGATRSGPPPASHAQQVTASALAARWNSSFQVSLQTSSRLWVAGLPTHSFDTGVTWKPLPHSTCATYAAKLLVVHPEASRATGFTAWGEPTSSPVGWAIPIALGVHPPHPSSFAPRSSRLTIDSSCAPRRLPASFHTYIYNATALIHKITALRIGICTSNILPPEFVARYGAGSLKYNVS